MSTQTYPIALLAFGASWPWDAQARGTLDMKGHSMEQQHRHHESGEGCAMCPVLVSSRQYSHEHLYLPCHPWGQEVLLVLGNLCHPGADKISTPNLPFFSPLLLWTTRPGTRMNPTVQSSSPAHSHSQRVEGTAGPRLPSLQHQPHWEPRGEAKETMLGTAHRSLSWGWGRQRWTCWAASLTGLPGGPGSPCRGTGVIASFFPNKPLSPHWDPTLPSPSPPGGQPVLELPMTRSETSGSWQCLGTCTQDMAAPGSTAPAILTHLSA